MFGGVVFWAGVECWVEMWVDLGKRTNLYGSV